MAKPTPIQAYHLALFRLVRAFGLVFAIGAVLVGLCNIPELLRTGNAEDWAMAAGAVVGFPMIGALLFIVGSRGGKQYRDYVDSLTD